MSDELRIASEDLRDLMRRLESKSILKGLRKALKAEATRLKRAASGRLRKATLGGRRLRDAAAVARTLRSGATKELDGLYVTATFVKGSERTQKGMHRNRAGRWKPVAFWLNHGVSDRHTKDGYGRSGRGKTPGRRRGRRTGEVSGLDYIEEIRRAETGRSADRLAKEYERAIRKIAEKALRN